MQKSPSRFPALAVSGYRAFFLSQSVSLIGTWMQNLALPWLAYTLTGSPFLLGLVGATQFLPTMLFSVFAGALTDRLVKTRTVLVTQIILFLSTMTLAILVIGAWATYPILLVLALVTGCANAMDFPARQAMVGELVGKELTMNAVALNSSLFNGARIVGPALAGIIMGTWGMGWCFALNALSFLPAIGVLSALSRTPPPPRPAASTRLLEDTRQGIRYAISQKHLRDVLLSVAAMSILAFNFSVLLPVLIKQELGLGETEYGLLMSFMGIGSFTGAFLIASRSHHGPRTIIFSLAPLVTSILFLAIGLLPWFWALAGLMVLVGFSNVSFFTTANSFLQVNSHYEYRGRVTALYALLFGGMTPVGNLFAGTLVEAGGPRFGFMVSGGLLLAIFLVWRAFTIIGAPRKAIAGSGPVPDTVIGPGPVPAPVKDDQAG